MICYSIELPGEGLVTWNVSALQAAALAGAFKIVTFPMWAQRNPPDYSKGFLIPERIAHIKKNPALLTAPGIIIEAPPDHRFGYICFVDGQHRATARYELGYADFQCYVVPWNVERSFRVELTDAEKESARAPHPQHH